METTFVPDLARLVVCSRFRSGQCLFYHSRLKFDRSQIDARR